MAETNFTSGYFSTTDYAIIDNMRKLSEQSESSSLDRFSGRMSINLNKIVLAHPQIPVNNVIDKVLALVDMPKTEYQQIKGPIILTTPKETQTSQPAYGFR